MEKERQRERQVEREREIERDGGDESEGADERGRYASELALASRQTLDVHRPPRKEALLGKCGTGDEERKVFIDRQ